MKSKKAIIFDLNGILIVSPYLSDRFRDEYGVAGDDFLPALKEIMAKIRMPNAGNAYSYWEPYLDKWGVEMSEQEFLDFWFTAEKENEDMTKVLDCEYSRE